MERTSFYELIREAWCASFTKKLPWVFGSFIALATLIENSVTADRANASSLEGLFQTILAKSPHELWTVFFILFLLFLLATFGKGNLISTLSFLTNKISPVYPPMTIRSLFKNFLSVFLLECIAFLLLVAIVAIFSLPLLIASQTKPQAIPLLLNLALLTFIPLALVVSQLKQFAFLYILLSPLKIRAAIETSGALFSKFITRSFLFTFLTLLLTLLFTFFVNLVILGTTTLSEKISLAPEESFLSFSFVASFVLFTWFAVFLQALWITFFKSIALPREPKKAAEEEAVPAEREILPEIPSAQ